jgi:CBS domain-containing protein
MAHSTQENRMRIRDLMRSDLPCVGPDDTVGKAASRMSEHRVKALPVLDGARLEGIITDWDVTRAVAAGGDPVHRPVADWMTTEPVTVPPDAQLDECSELMAERRIHHLLICEGDRFVGMVHLDVEWSHMGGLETPTASFTARI